MAENGPPIARRRPWENCAVELGTSFEKKRRQLAWHTPSARTALVRFKKCNAVPLNQWQKTVTFAWVLSRRLSCSNLKKYPAYPAALPSSWNFACSDQNIMLFVQMTWIYRSIQVSPIGDIFLQPQSIFVVTYWLYIYFLIRLHGSFLKRQPKNQIFPERYNILQIVFFASFLQPSDFTLNTQVTLKKGFKKSVTIFESHHSWNKRSDRP